MTRVHGETGDTRPHSLTFARCIIVVLVERAAEDISMISEIAK